MKIQSKILVIGYGNSLRCDDGVGQLVAIAVEKWNLSQVESLYLHQLTPELAEKIAEFESVIFIDASVKFPLPKKETQLKVSLSKEDLGGLYTSQEVKLTHLKYSSMNNNWTHYLTPESLIYLTEFLYQKTPQAWLINIPIKNLNFGEEISNLAEEGKQKALEIIKKLLHSENLENLENPDKKLCTK